MEITAPSDLFYPKALPGVTDTASALDMGKSEMCNNENFIKLFVNPLHRVHFQFFASKHDRSFCGCHLK